MDETIRQANCELQTENQKLQSLNTSLHKKYHTMSLKVIIFHIYMHVFNIIKINYFNFDGTTKIMFYLSWRAYKIM